MDIIFSSVTNHPVERDETRKGPIDHNATGGKGDPNSKSKRKYHFSPAVIGSIYKSNGPLPGIPKYTDIPLTGKLVLPAVYEGTYERKKEIIPESTHTYQWECYRLTIDGHYVCDAPMVHDDGKKLTTAQRQKFCMAVIWQLTHDEGSLRDQIAKLPINPLVSLTAEPDPVTVTLPEELNAYTHEAITGYPLARVDQVDLMEMNATEGETEEGYDYAEYDNVMTEFNLPAVSEMWQLINPVQAQNPANIIRSWSLPHLRCMITEEVRA